MDATLVVSISIRVYNFDSAEGVLRLLADWAILVAWLPSHGSIPLRCIAASDVDKDRRRVTRQEFDWGSENPRRKKMKQLFCKLFDDIKTAAVSDYGQNLAEFALVVALVASGSTAALSSTASGVNKAYTQISSNLASALPGSPAPPAKSPKTPKTPKTPKSPKKG